MASILNFLAQLKARQDYFEFGVAPDATKTIRGISTYLLNHLILCTVV